MAVGDLYRVTPRWNDSRNEFTTSMYYEQTGAGGAETVPSDLAHGWWDGFVLGGGSFPAMISDAAHVNSVYAAKVPAQGANQDEVSAPHVEAKVIGTGGPQSMGGINALKIRARNTFGLPEKTIYNYISISGISETQISSGAFIDNFINVIVAAFILRLGQDVVGPNFGGIFQFRVALDPRGPQRDFKAPLSVTATPSVLNQRIRQSERLGTA